MSHLEDAPAGPSVFVQSNDKDQNELLSFGRDMSGVLTPMGGVSTGGAGNGVPHLASQGSVTVSHDGRLAFATNAGSGDLSVFALSGGQPMLAQTVGTGNAPLSVAEYGGLVYVLNADDASLTGFRVDGRNLTPVAGPKHEWEPEGKPAQVGFSLSGRHLVVTERAADRIALFAVQSSGVLEEPVFHPSSGVTPYGFGFTPTGVLVVTEAFGGEPAKSAVSSYMITDSALHPVSRSVGNGRTALCWAVVSTDGRYAYAANFGDGAISRYEIAADGSLTLAAPAEDVVGDGSPGLRDLDLSPDGRFLYAIDADAHQLLGWSVDHGLTRIGSWSGLPPTVAGIAVR